MEIRLSNCLLQLLHVIVAVVDTGIRTDHPDLAGTRPRACRRQSVGPGAAAAAYEAPEHLESPGDDTPLAHQQRGSVSPPG